MKIYVVTMYRFGDRERHSYVLCAKQKKAQALKAAAVEEAGRGGKYSAEILEVDTRSDSIYDDDYKVIKSSQIADWLKTPEDYIENYGDCRE